VIRPQSALLTLYGDYARLPNGEVGIGSLVELLGNFGLSEQAVRSSVSRMCRAKMLKVRRRGKKSYYALTQEGRELLTKGGQRIFLRKNGRWDGTWTIVTYSIPEHKRKARDKLRLELRWLGYGALGEATWISPYDTTKELEELVEGLKIKKYFQIFQAKHLGFSDQKKIVSRCWDLNKTHENYASFVSKYRAKLREYQKRLKTNRPFKPNEYFVERFNLLHEYRKLPFFDPDLPNELLPKKWLRPEAIALFDQYIDLVADMAKEYFDSVIMAYEG
jgi:phenylacetic acid degradation operon negative regulatory protein